MSVIHVKSNTLGDFTGTVTGFNSQGSTTTLAASDMVRPSDWNSGHNQYFTLTGNTSNASTVSGTNIVLEGGNNITLAGNGATISIVGAAGGGGGGVTRNYYNPQDGYVQVAGQQGQATMHVQPAYMNAVTFDRIAMPIVVSNSSNSTGSATISFGVGIYTRNNSTMSLLSSTSASFAVTYSGTVNNSTFAGMRLATIGWTGSLDENQYYVGIWSRTTTGGTNASISQFLASQINSVYSGIFGAASNATLQYTRGLGHYSATFSTAVPNSFHISEIRGTASVALRQPVFYLVNGTF